MNLWNILCYAEVSTALSEGSVVTPDRESGFADIKHRMARGKSAQSGTAELIATPT